MRLVKRNSPFGQQPAEITDVAKVDFHPNMIGLGARIRMLREMKGWTQGDLAEQSQVEQSSISNYEADKRPGVPLAHIMRLADALGSPIQFLAYGREWEKPSNTKSTARQH